MIINANMLHVATGMSPSTVASSKYDMFSWQHEGDARTQKNRDDALRCKSELAHALDDSFICGARSP